MNCITVKLYPTWFIASDWVRTIEGSYSVGPDSGYIVGERKRTIVMNVYFREKEDLLAFKLKFNV